MDARLLLWVSLAVGLVTVVGAAVTSPRSANTGNKAGPINGPSGWAAVAIPFLGFLVTLPSHGTLFSAGHGLGMGILIGGLGALVFAVLSARRASIGDTDAAGIAFALPAMLASVTLLFFRSMLLDALLGEAIGWFAVAAFLWPSLRSTAFPDTSEPSGQADALVLSTGVMATVAATAVLGTLLNPRTLTLDRGTWAGLAMVLTAIGGLFRWVSSLLRSSEDSSGPRVVSPVVVTGLLALIGLLAAKKEVGDLRLFSCLLTGLLLWPVAVWVHRTGRTAGSGTTPGTLPFLPMLLVAGGSILAGQLLRGYGAAVFTTGIWLSAAALWPAIRPSDSGRARQLESGELRLLLFGTALALFRCAEGRWIDDLRGAALLSDHYALFGLLAGIAAPVIASGSNDSRHPLLRSVSAGLLSLLLPAAIVTLFGPKCVLPLLIGASLGPLLGENLFAALVAIGIGLVVDQCLGRALPLADLTRGERMKTLGILTALTAVVVLGGGLFERKPAGGSRIEES